MFNKINVCVVILIEIITVIIALSSIFQINNQYSWFNKTEALLEYLNTTLMFFKLIIVIINSYLWGSSFSEGKDSYHLLFNNFKNIKLKYLLTKILTLFFLSFFIIFMQFVIFSIFGITCSNWFESNKNIVVLFVTYLIIVIVFGFLSIIFSLIIKSDFAYFISPALFVLGEFIINDNINQIPLIKIFQVFIPNVSLNMISYSSFGIIHLIILSVLYLGIVIYLYLNIKK